MEFDNIKLPNLTCGKDVKNPQQTRFQEEESELHTWATETDCMAATLVAISTKPRGTQDRYARAEKQEDQLSRLLSLSLSLSLSRWIACNDECGKNGVP